MAALIIGFSAAIAGPRLNQLQVIGTHNSYHVAPHPSVDAVIRTQHGEEADALAYTHRPLTDQLERLGIRQLELDLYLDSQGGLFAEPKGIALAAAAGMAPAPGPDLAQMREAGIKVFHVPDFDFQTTVSTLRGALEELNTWSRAHPAHVPVFVLLELKSTAAGPEFTQPTAWNTQSLQGLEREIGNVFRNDRLLRPDDVRGGHATLRQAVLQDGWPELARARGRVIFALDNTDEIRDQYLARSATLEGRMMFVSVDEAHPAAGWFKINDPVAEFARIERLVREGFLVRTRADDSTVEARRQDATRRERAFSSGAQFVSTDYPEPYAPWGPYCVRWPGGAVARANPVSGPDLNGRSDLEPLALAGVGPFAREELELLNRRAFRFHSQRRLDEASADYDRLLALDPPSKPTPTQRERILALAPTLRLVDAEPFALESIVAIHHPTQALIAYHLFWDDDVDFPDDNDPTDHEIVWVRYDAASGRPQELSVYFHGRILGCEPRSTQSTVAVAVEWGKHGSLPFASPDDPQPAHVEVLRGNWRRLSEHGTLRPKSPLARGWPTGFNGDFAAYTRFPNKLQTAERLADSGFLFVSSWANATVNRHALSFNFAAKLEWPAETTPDSTVAPTPSR